MCGQGVRQSPVLVFWKRTPPFFLVTLKAPLVQYSPKGSCDLRHEVDERSIA